MFVYERNSLDGNRKVKMVKKIHEIVYGCIEKKNKEYVLKPTKVGEELSLNQMTGFRYT